MELSTTNVNNVDFNKMKKENVPDVVSIEYLLYI